MPARPLAFRYLYKSGVIKENTVTVFGELGSVFQKGADYDEEVDLTVPYMDLSNLIMYYTGTVADGTVGSPNEGSLRNLNAPVSNVRNFLKFSNADNATGANHYYVGDIVMFDPVTGEGTSSSASCWTCIRTTTDLTSPIPELANEIAAASAADKLYNNNFNNTGKSGPGMTGIDNRGQRYIVGVMPAIYNPLDGTITNSPYWRESAIAKSYFTGGNYYQGELVVFNGLVYQCKSTNGLISDPPLQQRVRYTLIQEQNDANGVTVAAPEDLIPPLDLALAPNGAFGFDSSGTRYLMGVPPSGGLFSGLFWEPATLPRTPTGAYINVNWDNTSIVDKLQFYDSNVTGGGGAQSIPTFTDDVGNTITTLRKIYDDNEKSFVLTIANQILSTIPAAAIKSQAISSKVEPDNTLLELVNLGPTNSKPSEYTPAIQGLFEESVARDMLRISGFEKTITEILVTDGSSGYTAPPRVQIIGGLSMNPKLVPYFASAKARLGVKSVKIDKTNPTWNSVNTGKRYGVGDVLSFVSVAAPLVACIAKVYRIDANGNILSILITNKGSGYVDLPKVEILGVHRTFLEPVLEVLTVDLQYRDTGFYDDMQVRVEFGSGSGAVGYAVTQTVDGVRRLTAVKFDGATRNDSTASIPYDYDLSRGTNYVAGNFKKDIVALQGVIRGAGGEITPVQSAKSVGVVTATQSGGIVTLVVINNGSGYTSNPSVVIDPPEVDNRNNARLVKNINTNVVELTSFLPPIAARGVYTEPPVPTFTIVESPANAVEAPKVTATAYLGLNGADIKFGGSGYSQEEYLSVTGGGITPAEFRVTHNLTTDTYSAIVMDGGDGYSISTDLAKLYLNEIVLQDDSLNAPVGDQLVGVIDSLGGGIVDVTFNNGRPTGEGFAVDDTVIVGTGDSAFRIKVTSVGDEGAIAPTGFTPRLTAVDPSGYSEGQTVLATSKFYSVNTVTLPTPQIFTGTNQPIVTIVAPTGSFIPSAGNPWNPTLATAVPSLKVSSISVTNGGTGYQLGDVITITQVGALTCQAFVLALSNVQTGAVGVVAVGNAGSGFDISKTGADAVIVHIPTTTGTPLQVNVSYAVDKIVVTNPGVGYEIAPVATLQAGSGPEVPLNVTIKKAGGSSASFRVTSVNPNGMPEIAQLSPGSGYLVNDILALADGDGGGAEAYVLVSQTQSRGVKTGTIVRGYRGYGYSVSSNLIDAPCSVLGSTAIFPNIKYAVTKVTNPNSISKISFPRYYAPPGATRYQPITLYHKPHARVKVGSVDSSGSILTLTVESPGFGYTSPPTIKPRPTTRGNGASLIPLTLGVSRVEFTGTSLAVITSSDVQVSGDGIVASSRTRPATAIAQLAGDLNTISTDPVKNPNILETLELLKPGSTNGYARAKPNMGVSSVDVTATGRGYNMGLDSNGAPITFVEVTAPDLPNGVRPTFAISFNALAGISNIVVVTSGSGYSKIPKALVKMSVNPQVTLPAEISLRMKLLDGFLTSGGQGFAVPPSAEVSPPDLNGGNAIGTVTTTLKTSINGFNILSPGAQYLTPPKALVVGPGNGAEAVASMGISEIYVVNGGSGYAVGDMLVIPAPPSSTETTANATVTGVTSTGSITRVRLARSRFPVVTADIQALKDDFVLNGGSGYLTLPVITGTLKRPSGSTATLYVNGAPDPALANSDGTNAVFSTRLGVSRIDFTSAGSGYESDATVLIQDPPSSQAANFAAVINGVGQLNAYVKNSGGSGYTRPPGARVDGNGVGAQVTPLMGVSEVAIVTSGKGYSVGDVVTFTGGNPVEAANGVVTVIDGGIGIGYGLTLTVDNTFSNELTVTDDGGLQGTVGAIQSPVIIEGGYNFEVGDVISLLPETRLPTREMLDSIRTIGGNTILTGGKLTQLRLVTTMVTNDFKAGMIMKVTPTPAAVLAGVDAGAVAFIRINVVLDTLSGTGWHSINPYFDDFGIRVRNTQFISSPGDKYGQLIPALWYDSDYAYGDFGEAGIQGYSSTILASNNKWGSNGALFVNSNLDPNTQKLKFDVVTQDEATYPGSTAYFKVTQVLSSVGAVIQASPCDSTGVIGTSTGMFYSAYDLVNYTGNPRGRISFIQILNPGSGYQSNPTAIIDTGSRAGVEAANVVTTLGVVALRIDQRGSGYTANPVITIEAPDHRALTAQGYARSGIFDIDVHDFEVIDQGAGYTGQFIDNTGTTQDGGSYRLVGGALHQTGGAAESIDGRLVIRPGAFSNGKLLANTSPTNLAAIRAATDVVLRGSNYRVGDILSIVATGPTTSGNQAIPAKIRIKQISKQLDINTVAVDNTGAGILDYAKKENGEDVGAYGTGYFQPPSIRVLGGSQGVTLATSLGVAAIDFTDVGLRGTDYQNGDLIQMISPEFSNPVDIGIVLSSDYYTGSVLDVLLYEPFSKGLNAIPTLSIKRKDSTYRTNYNIGYGNTKVDAVPKAVLGVTVAATTASTDGFIGRPYVFVEPPTGKGYFIQPTTSAIVPILVNEVATVNVSYDVTAIPEYVTTVPRITIAPPPSVEKFSGWRSVRFSKEDSFEVIVQYTIAKAISFQVDPDASLPSSYFTAESITIGGVVIPLRQSGGKGMQGRELSANRIIRRYKIKFIAV
jgi:hypothetical protein